MSRKVLISLFYVSLFVRPETLMKGATLNQSLPNQEESYQDGADFAKNGISFGTSFLNEDSARKEIQDYTTDPGEMNEDHPANRAYGKFAKDVVSDQLAGPRMMIDPNTDPLFINANQAVEDPDATLMEQKMTFIDDQDYREETCIETRDEEFEVMNTASIDPYYENFEVWQFYNHCPNTPSHCGWGKRLDCPNYQRNNTILKPKRNPDADYEEIHGMNWKGDAHPELENLKASGQCRLTKEMPREEGRASRMIAVKFYKKEETPKGWHITLIDDIRQGRSRFKRPEDFGVESFIKTQVFICSYHSPGNTCKPLRERGGVEVTSTCMEHMGNICVKWEKTYKVPKQGAVPKTITTLHHAHQKAFNADGAMNDTGYEENKEGLEAIAKLQAIHDSSAALPKIETDDPNSLAIFGGENLKCETQGGELSYHGCPGQRGDKNPEEVKLEELEKQGKCIQVDLPYDSEKRNFGTLIGQKRKVTSYCCFETILSKTLQQGAINQGIKSLGCPKSPHCGPLTLAQIQALNWDLIDFGPFVADMMSQVNLNSGHVAQKSATTIEAHLRNQNFQGGNQ